MHIRYAIRTWKVFCFPFLLVLLAFPIPSASQDDTVDVKTLRFGMSTALTGPAAQLGINMRTGVLAAFNEENGTGGIGGKKLELIALDDGYEPTRTAPNMKRLIDKEEVLAVIGNVGTPTAIAAVPIANTKKTLFFGAYTGAGVLRRTPPDRYVINYRADYPEETAAIVDALINIAGLNVDEIGFFTQRDAYGDAGYFGGIAALKRHGLTDDHNVAHGRYERNTSAVENGLADIMGAHSLPRAIIMVGAYEPCAAFIKLAKELDLDFLYANLSFVGSAPFVQALQGHGEGVIITQVVPHTSADLPLIHRYHAALIDLDSKAIPSFGSLEGYIVATILIRALESLEASPTRETVIDALENLGTFDIGLGEELRLDRMHHQASCQIWPTVIRGESVHPFSWDELERY